MCVLSLFKCDRGSVMLGWEPYSCLHGLFLLCDGIWKVCLAKGLSSCNGIWAWLAKLSLPVKPSTSLPLPSDKSSDVISKQSVNWVLHPQMSLREMTDTFLQRRQRVMAVRMDLAWTHRMWECWMTIKFLSWRNCRVFSFLFSSLEEYLMS